MAESPNEFQVLLERARNGCQQAAQDPHHHYSTPLRIVIRKHLSRKVRNSLDSVDVLQSLWREFFADALLCETFARPENLLAFLTRMATNKARQTNRRVLGTQKRDPSREVPLEAAHESQLIDPHLEPHEGVQREEEWQWFLANFPPHWQRGLTLLREGYSHEEVASHLDVSARTVSRLIERVRCVAATRPSTS
jgi:DNA-directed RNA polymerase specialized sigma24 family protein